MKLTESVSQRSQLLTLYCGETSGDVRRNKGAASSPGQKTSPLSSVGGGVATLGRARAPVVWTPCDGSKQLFPGAAAAWRVCPEVSAQGCHGALLAERRAAAEPESPSAASLNCCFRRPACLLLQKH